MTLTANQQLLNTQRKNRPISPYLTIWRPGINYITSPLHRITDCIISGAFYVFGATYLVAPSFSLHIDEESLFTWFGGLPLAAKVGLKYAMAFPVVFHGINGVSHLLWDTGRKMIPKRIVVQA